MIFILYNMNYYEFENKMFKIVEKINTKYINCKINITGLIDMLKDIINNY